MPVPFAKVKNGRSFSYKGVSYVKLDATSAESEFAVAIFQDETVTV